MHFTLVNIIPYSTVDEVLSFEIRLNHNPAETRQESELRSTGPHNDMGIVSAKVISLRQIKEVKNQEKEQKGNRHRRSRGGRANKFVKFVLCCYSC